MSIREPVRPGRAVKVIHIVENLNRGAVENWLVRMFRHARTTGVDLDWTFYCVEQKAGLLDQEVRVSGASVIHSPAPLHRKLTFSLSLRRELAKGGYDVLHCHHDLVSSVYLMAAAGLPIKRRIVHVHNADESVPTPNLGKQFLYREPMRRVCLALADRIVGISSHTLDTMLGGRGRRESKDIVVYYGVDAKPFSTAFADRAAFRDKLGFSESARIVLFLGRLVPEKNPLFVLDVLAGMRRIDPTIVGVFAGTGSLEGAVAERAKSLGINNAIRLLGWRRDVANIMASCDLFILPRPEQPKEGFGLAVVEAQLAGLRLLLSRGVPDDPLLSTAVYRRISLSAGAEAWARGGIELLREPAPPREAALGALANSPFDMEFALQQLRDLHCVSCAIPAAPRDDSLMAAPRPHEM
jgi:glycosyltransferase involved in cell wall biosynthesis